MSTIAEFRLPVADVALAVALERLDGATIELEPSVSTSLPCLWVEAGNPDAVGAALSADPTVTSFDRLVDTDDRGLYDVTFADRPQAVWEDLLAADGSLLEATATDRRWLVRMRFRRRAALVETHDRLEERGVSADLRRVTELTDATTGDSRLTPEQREALEAAFESGYFEIPRRISMEELAAELGISHQALSERLRRAYETLVDTQLQPAHSR